MTLQNTKKMSPEWLAEKDKAMTKDADEGIAVILDKGGAGATRKNIKHLSEQGKNVFVSELSSISKKMDINFGNISITDIKNF